MISKYFSVRDVAFSHSAIKLGLSNLPKEEHILNATALAVGLLDKLHDNVGPLLIHSWYRSESLEYNLCKTQFEKWCRDNVVDPKAQDAWFSYFKRKQHPKGCAVSISSTEVDNDHLFAYIKLNLEFDNLVRKHRTETDPFSGYVHVSFDRFGANRKQSFV